MGYYDVAQICLNGHVITRNADRSPEFRQRHCKKCGELTITECPRCNRQVQGEYHVEGVVVIGSGESSAPNFCHECGSPYPWTERRIEAARTLADDLEELSDDDRKNLKLSLDELYRDSPKTEVAATRFKRIMAKVGKDSYSAMKSIVTDLLTEAMKKTIFGG